MSDDLIDSRLLEKIHEDAWKSVSEYMAEVEKASTHGVFVGKVAFNQYVDSLSHELKEKDCDIVDLTQGFLNFMIEQVATNHNYISLLLDHESRSIVAGFMEELAGKTDNLESLIFDSMDKIREAGSSKDIGDEEMQRAYSRQLMGFLDLVVVPYTVSNEVSDGLKKKIDSSILSENYHAFEDYIQKTLDIYLFHMVDAERNDDIGKLDAMAEFYKAFYELIEERMPRSKNPIYLKPRTMVSYSRIAIIGMTNRLRMFEDIKEHNPEGLTTEAGILMEKILTYREILQTYCEKNMGNDYMQSFIDFMNFSVELERATKLYLGVKNGNSVVSKPPKGKH